jgi:hypothetical protein
MNNRGAEERGPMTLDVVGPRYVFYIHLYFQTDILMYSQVLYFF